MNPLLPGSSFGRYRLLSELGRGGMGVVYLAADEPVGRRVALKVLGPELADNEEFSARFAREMRIAARLEHPNIVPVYETGTIEDRLFIAMRFIDGADLSRAIGAGGPISSQRVVRIIEMVGAALDAAHAQGLVHRDVKPGNVLLSGADQSEHAYLTDFGLSREAASDSGLTNTGQWMGTADYVSPEQLDAKPISARSDIYSMSCLIYNMLTARLPYEGSLVAKLKGHAFEPLPGLPGSVPNAVAVEAVLERGCAKDAADRFPSAGDLAAALTAALRGEPAPTSERTVATGAALSGIVTRAGARPAAGWTEVTAAQDPQTHDVAKQTVLEAARQRPPAEASAPPRAARGPRWRTVGVAGLCLLALGAGAAAALSRSGGAERTAVLPGTSTRAAAATTTTIPTTTTIQQTTTVHASQTVTVDDARQFHAPSGNVSCAVDADGARCSVASAGTTFVLPPDGVAYTSGEVAFPRGTGPLAAYGSTVMVGTVRCRVPLASERRGIRCENSETGHGFEASRHPTRQRVY